MSTPAVSLSHVTLAYNDEPIMLDATVSIPTGTICAFVGPNGAGKTTLLKAIMGLLTPISGHITVHGVSDTSRARHIAYVPQRRSIDWDFPISVLEVVVMGCYGRLRWYQRPPAAEYQRARDMIARVGLTAYMHQTIGALSGGQQQLVFLARALMQDAPILCLDEPFTGVDAVTEKIIIEQFKQLRAQGRTVILVHHDLHTVQEYFEWVVLINRRIVAAGPLLDVFTTSAINETYNKSTCTCGLH